MFNFLSGADIAVLVIASLISLALLIAFFVCIFRIRKETIRIRRELLDVLRALRPGVKFRSEFYDDDDDDDDNPDDE